jgi:hypothetical protein
MAFKMKGSPAKLGTISGTAGHSSALKHLGKHPSKKDGHTKDSHKGQGLFERIAGKKFKETTLGKDLQKKKEDIQSLIKNPKKHVVTKDIEKKLEKKTDVKVLGTTDLEVHKSSSGSGVIKPSGKNKAYTSTGGKGHMFTRGGGDPYQYRTTDEGKSFEYKKVGETDWVNTKGGFDKISSSYTKSKESSSKMKGSPAKYDKKKKTVTQSERTTGQHHRNVID